MHRLTKYEDFGEQLPIVPFYIDSAGKEEKVYAILDTGSEMTIFDKKLVARHPEAFHVVKHDVMLNTIGIYGENKDYLTTACVSACFDETGNYDSNMFAVQMEGNVLDIAYAAESYQQCHKSAVQISVLIGCDFLAKYKAVIDMEDKTLSLDDLHSF